MKVDKLINSNLKAHSNPQSESSQSAELWTELSEDDLQQISGGGIGSGIGNAAEGVGSDVGSAAEGAGSGVGKAAS